MNKNIFLLFITLFFINKSYSQWTEQVSSRSNALISISAVDNNNVWVCGGEGTVLRTINGGINWINVSTISDNFYNIFAIDSLNALTGSSTGNVYKTTNGGANWILVFSQVQGFIDGIWMTSSSNGFLFGDPVAGRWSLWKTTNGGYNWDSSGLFIPRASTEYGWNNSLFILGQDIWFGTTHSRIYHSNNYGINWTIQTTSSTYSNNIWFSTNTNGSAAGLDFFTTTNGGTNWNTLPITGAGLGYCTGLAVNDQNVWVTRQDSIVCRSTNYGTTWNVEYLAPAGHYNHLTRARNGTRIWAVRWNGGISKSDGVIGIEPISTITPIAFSLSQNSPNPFNPSTAINFAITKKGNVTLKVFDPSGKEIETMLNENLSPGTYRIDFDGSKYSSGVYLYTLETNGARQSKKMVLLK